MDIRHLEAFHAAVRLGSFVRAAEALQYAQSTITLQIQQIEQEFGVALFEREGRRLRLTEAGRIFRDQTAPLLERLTVVRETMAELATGVAGHVRFGAIEPAARQWIAPLVARFCAERPRVRLTLEVGGTLTVSERVAAGELDAGLCSPPHSRLGLRFEPLFVEPMALLLHESDPLAAAPQVNLDMLARARLLVTESGCAYREVIERALAEHGVVAGGEGEADARPGAGTGLGVTVEISSGAVLVRVVQSGHGAAVLPRAYADPAPPGTVFRDVQDLDLGLTVGLVQRSDTTPGRALAAFMDAVRAAAPGAAAPRAALPATP